VGRRFIEEGDNVYAYNDETLDLYLELLAIISVNDNWIFFEALANFHDSFIFYDCNELTYQLYRYAKERAIPYEIRNFPKWHKVYGIDKHENRLCGKILRSPILFSEETRRVDKDRDTSFPNTCFAFLNTIFKVNIFMECLGQDGFHLNVEKAGISVERLPVESAYASYLELQTLMNDDKVSRLLDIVRQATSKKIAGILCNCQGEILFRMLIKQKSFTKNYFVLLLPPLWYIKEKSIQYICEDIFNKFDLFIYQHVKTTFYQPFFATQNIIPLLKKGHRRIGIPDLYFDGYFPQIDHVDRPMNVLLRNLSGDTIFQVRDYYIEETYKRTNSITKTKELLLLEEDSSMVFDKGKVIQKWNNAIERMIDAEKNVDLKMSDYILDNIKGRRLFVAAHNPVNELMYVETERLMEMLDLPFGQFDYEAMMNFEGAQEVIYPFVKKVLDLKFNSEQYYVNKAFVDKKYRIEEYIELYIRNICEFE